MKTSNSAKLFALHLQKHVWPYNNPT